MAIIVREWRMDALHDLYALGDPNEIIGRVDAMNEHNACVTALRAALAREAEIRATLAANDIVSLPNDYPTARMAADRMQRITDLTLEGLGIIGRAETSLADAARLREALRLHTVDNSGCDVCQGRWRVDQPEIHAPGCLAAPL